MQNGDVYEASIKDIDKKSDIATIKVDPQVSPPAVVGGGQPRSTLLPAFPSYHLPGSSENPAG